MLSEPSVLIRQLDEMEGRGPNMQTWQWQESKPQRVVVFTVVVVL